MALGNTATRIIVSVIAIPLILLACIYGEIPFLIFVMGIASISFWEFTQLVKNKDANVNFNIGILSVIVIVLNSYFKLIDFQIIIIVFSVLLMLLELFRNNGSAILNVGVTFLGVIYLGLFSSTIVLIREYFAHSEILYSEGGYLIISILVSIWVCDSAQFLFGYCFWQTQIISKSQSK